MAIGTTEEISDAVDELPRTKLIPTLEDNAFYSLRVRLDGLDYNLRFAWNERAGRWFMDIFSDDNQALAVGVKIIANWPLLRYYQFDKRLPQGEMMAIDTTPDGSPPGFNDLAPDKRVQLIYFPTTDL